MIFNIINKHPASYVVLVSLFSLFFLASCSAGEENESADVAAFAERHPEQVEKAVDSIEHRSGQAKEATASIERRPAYTDHAAAAIERHPEHTEQAAASVERHPDYSQLSASSAVSSSGHTQQPAASVSRRPANIVESASAESSPELAQNTSRVDDYRVVLGVDEIIRIPGIAGELRVWIGSPDYSPNFPERMVQDETTLPAVGESATVQPFAPAFKISPTETQCIKIHPSGSEVRFKLTPQKQGTFEVGANVYLFDSADCSGSPIPKTAATLKVSVEVDKKEIFIEKVHELLDVLWEKFVDFWAALVAILLGLILFLIRGKLKKWFGYTGD